jgi:excisionase family DNA binding protein
MALTAEVVENPLMTLTEAAAAVRCSKAHLSNVINRKVPGLPQLPVVRIGRRLLVRREALNEWLRTVER